MECLNEKKWLVVYTKPKGEKKLLKRYLDKGIETYCPMYKTLRQWSDRKKMVTMPLFTSYMFVRINENERSTILQDPLAVRFIYWLGKPAVIRDQDMEELKKFLCKHSNIQVESIELSPGAGVEIKEGPFKGEHALISQIDGDKIRLNLPQIGCRLVANFSKQELTIS